MKTLGQIAFEKWTSLSGSRVTWADLDSVMRAKWASVALAVIAEADRV